MIYIPFIIINFIYANLSLNLIAENFDKPIFATSNSKYPNSIYILEQGGLIKIIKDSNTYLFLDLSDRVHNVSFPGDEMGLLGLAFDPDFEKNGFLYVNYNDKNDNTIISRFSSDENIGDLSSEKILFKLSQPYSNHNGGCIQFGPDGYLYISIGDGGSSGDPENRAQDLTNFFGSILRLQIPKDGDSYIIPADNPFYFNDFDFKKEIWMYGLRNVWRFSFDGLTGDMYLGDVGQNSWEEINFIPSDSKGGINFGWNIMEASNCYKNDVECKNLTSQLPIFEYPNDAKYIRTILGLKHKNVHGCSVTGGYVYRGSKIQELYGKYIFGDYCTGKIWSFRFENDNVSNFQDHTDKLLGSINKEKFYLSSFGETNDGELLLLDYSGSIYKLVNK